MPEELVLVENLVKSWGYKKILNSLQFKAFSHEVIIIKGANGSGKTTFLNVLSGFTSYTQGNISIMGCKLPQGFQFVKHQLGFLSHEPMLYKNLTVLENLWLFGKLHHVYKLEEEIDRLTTLFGLKIYLNELARVLSKGTLQKVAICRLFVHNPNIILMDEPFSNLDEESVLLVQRIITSEHKKGKLIIIATHDSDFVDNLCTRVEILHQGKLSPC